MSQKQRTRAQSKSKKTKKANVSSEINLKYLQKTEQQTGEQKKYNKIILIEKQ